MTKRIGLFLFLSLSAAAAQIKLTADGWVANPRISSPPILSTEEPVTVSAELDGTQAAIGAFYLDAFLNQIPERRTTLVWKVELYRKGGWFWFWPSKEGEWTFNHVVHRDHQGRIHVFRSELGSEEIFWDPKEAWQVAKKLADARLKNLPEQTNIYFVKVKLTRSTMVLGAGLDTDWSESPELTIKVVRPEVAARLRPPESGIQTPNKTAPVTKSQQVLPREVPAEPTGSTLPSKRNRTATPRRTGNTPSAGPGKGFDQPMSRPGATREVAKPVIVSDCRRALKPMDLNTYLERERARREIRVRPLSSEVYEITRIDRYPFTYFVRVLGAGICEIRNTNEMKRDPVVVERLWQAVRGQPLPPEILYEIDCFPGIPTFSLECQPARIDVRKRDHNRDGVEDLIVTWSPHCGASGQICTLFAFTMRNGKYVLIDRFGWSGPY